jgi:hypothetical protein
MDVVFVVATVLLFVATAALAVAFERLRQER